MNDDWRLQVDLDDSHRASSLVEQLGAPDLRHDLSDVFHDRVVVSHDGARVFLYAGTKGQAEAARKVVADVANRQAWQVRVDLKRWHPVAEDWEVPSKPLPETDAAKAAEHEALMAAERRDVEERGRPEFDVRADLPSRHDAVRFAERLRGEGLPVVRRWKFVLVGVEDEDSAKALADRIRGEAPAGSKVGVEGTWQAAYAERSPNPFAFLGGLAG